MKKYLYYIKNASECLMYILHEIVDDRNVFKTITIGRQPSNGSLLTAVCHVKFEIP